MEYQQRRGFRESDTTDRMCARIIEIVVLAIPGKMFRSDLYSVVTSLCHDKHQIERDDNNQDSRNNNLCFLKVFQYDSFL